MSIEIPKRFQPQMYEVLDSCEPLDYYINLSRRYKILNRKFNIVNNPTMSDFLDSEEYKLKTTEPSGNLDYFVNGSYYSQKITTLFNKVIFCPIKILSGRERKVYLDKMSNTNNGVDSDLFNNTPINDCIKVVSISELKDEIEYFNEYKETKSILLKIDSSVQRDVLLKKFKTIVDTLDSKNKRKNTNNIKRKNSFTNDFFKKIKTNKIFQLFDLLVWYHINNKTIDNTELIKYLYPRKYVTNDYNKKDYTKEKSRRLKDLNRYFHSDLIIQLKNQLFIR